MALGLKTPCEFWRRHKHSNRSNVSNSLWTCFSMLDLQRDFDTFTCQIKFPTYYTVSQEKVPGDWWFHLLSQQKLIHTDREFEGSQWSQVGKPLALWCKGEKQAIKAAPKHPNTLSHAILFLGFSMNRWILKLGKPYLVSAVIKKIDTYGESGMMSLSTR